MDKDIIKAFRKANREIELERNGGRWIAINRPHKNKKAYDRKRDRRIDSDCLFYFNYLKESSNVVRDITFLTKAEDQVLSVACASVISRYLFLKEYDKLSGELGFILPKGAGPIVDEVGKKIVQKFGKEKLNEVAKLSFKNTEKILNK